MWLVFKQKGTNTRLHAWGPFTKAELEACLARLRKDKRDRVWNCQAYTTLPGGIPHLPFGARPKGTAVDDAVAECLKQE